MAAAGFIPIVGWAGRIVKGGGAIYKTAKGMHAADQALDVYRTTKSFSNLEKAEMGIYGLVSANGFSEYLTGKDMFGNELTDEQRQASLLQSVIGSSLIAAPFAPQLVKNGKLIREQTISKAHKLATKTKADLHFVMNEVSGGFHVLINGMNHSKLFVENNSAVQKVPLNVMDSESVKKVLDGVLSKFTFNGVGKGTDIPVQEVDDYFIGTLKGENIHLKDVKVEEIIYTKRLPEETAKLRKEFNRSVRKNFLKEFVNHPVRIEHLRKAGLGEDDIARMKDGLNPKGWQVHHNLPLDDGGTNDFTNLVLIKNDPYHKAITNEQNSLTRGLSPKESITINWPMFEEEIYPPKPF